MAYTSFLSKSLLFRQPDSIHTCFACCAAESAEDGCLSIFHVLDLSVHFLIPWLARSCEGIDFGAGGICLARVRIDVDVHLVMPAEHARTSYTFH